jgi:hypothetical protein
MNYKKVFERFDDKNVFLKTSVPSSIDSSLKTALNRKGNVLFNSGDVEAAKRIFMTTGYSDGLSRVGDFYKSRNRLIEALRMYKMAHDQTKSEPLIAKLADVIRNIIRDDEGPSDA